MNAITAAPVMRPKMDRFLAAILVGFAVLLVVAGVIVALSRRPVLDLSADTPGGTVQRFYSAVEQQDYDKAYDFLSDRMLDKPTREKFIQHNIGETSRYREGQGDSIRIDDEKLFDDTAIITAKIIHYVNIPFGGSNEWSETETFRLQRDEGAWLITVLPYAFMPYKYEYP